MGFRICTKLHSCAHSQLQTFSSLQKAPPYPLGVPSPSRPLASTSVPSASGFACLDISCQWNHILWPFVSGLSSLSVVSRFIHVACISASFLVLFFFLRFIYLLFGFYLFFILCFIYLLLTVLGVRCCVWAFFSCGERDRSLGVRSTGSRRAGFSSCVHGLRFPAACGTFPDQRRNPRPLHLQAHSLPLSHQGSPFIFF